MKTFTYAFITGTDNFKFSVSRGTLNVNAFELHTHEFSELVIILGGTAIHMTDMGHYPIAAGDVFVLNGSMAHGFADCAGLRLCNIAYDPAQLLSTSIDVQQLPGYHALFTVEPLYRVNHPMQNVLRLRMDMVQQVDAIIDSMLAEHAEKSPGYASMLQAYFMQLVVMLSRLHAAQIDSRSESIGRLGKR